MLTMLCILLFTKPDAAWRTDVEIYRPLTRDTVAVSPAGETYLLDVVNCRVIHLDAGGTQVGAISRKGEGPGELQRPSKVLFRDDKLYVYEIAPQKIHVFDPKGAYRTVLHVPFRGMTVYKSVAGWVMVEPNLIETHPQKAFHFNEDLSEKQPLDTWQRGKQTYFQIRKPGDPPRKVIPVNPANDFVRQTISADGERFYLGLPGEQPQLVVLDIRNRKRLAVLPFNAPLIPFNETWGQEQLAEVRENAKRANRPFRYGADFPDFMPFFKDLFIGPDGDLVMVRYSADPESNSNYQVLNRDGKPKKSNLTEAALYRVLTYRDDQAYVTTLNPESGAAGMARVPRNKVNNFLAANPIEEEE
ncbi:MAG: hypothetical protein QNK37_13765 [Acidobacteriota bacterium]|nr:hypothetical protein [Acidobacteriota bacterium]